MEELKDILKDLEKMLESGKADFEADEKKAKENMEKGIKEVKKQLDEEDMKTMIFVSQERTITVGRAKDLLNILSCLIHGMKRTMPFESLIRATLLGLCMDEEVEHIQSKNIEKVLEVLRDISEE